MKTIFILLAAVTISFGQIEQGTYQLGGGIGFQMGSDKRAGVKTERTFWHISPQASYFLIDNFAIGLGLSYFSASSTNNSEFGFKNDNSVLFFGPVVQYYLTLKEDILPFITASYGHSISEFDSEFDTKSDLLTLSSSSTSDIYKIGAGITFFLNDFVSLEPVLVYEVTKYVTESKNNLLKISGVPVQNGHSSYESSALVFSMGVSYYIK